MIDPVKVLLGHGGGGELSYQLIKNVFMPIFDNPVLREMDDAARLASVSKRLAFSTDSYVVKPLFFPGGDIGKLAVCGTINDLAMVGAEPLFMSTALIIEEGFSLDTLKEILHSMERVARQTGIQIVTGDTKVVERGSLDQLFINTAGIGIIEDGLDISCSNAMVGDRIIVSGMIGDHGIAVLSQREGFHFESKLTSDCAPLDKLVSRMVKKIKNIHVLRDPTRGGLVAALNEIAIQSGIEMLIEEKSLPIRDEVRAACEMLGLDPLHIPCEGRLIAFVAEEDAHSLLEVMREDPSGTDAAMIGEVIGRNDPQVYLQTLIGSRRILFPPRGELLPRIC